MYRPYFLPQLDFKSNPSPLSIIAKYKVRENRQAFADLTMSQDPWRHLAAISPYFHIHQQPPTPALQATRGAVYLFRHGVLEVSQYDYAAYIAVFMAKLQESRARGPIGKDSLAFLNHYRTWITESHVGLVSASGINQSFQLGKTFRQRYAHWLVSDLDASRTMQVWSDEAFRCRASAAAFATAFSGTMLLYLTKGNVLH
jgi:hypothetical protein